mmetsp:Transcript_27485/g.88273  ORF Transcript_27485/g.88273 Transcript_27485/m.88273 type:complete len:348 (+) Transcript_27485:394-1437(+)
MSRHSMQPLTGSQLQIVTDPELGCNKDCWRMEPEGSTIIYDHEPTINYLYPLRRREFMAESRQRYQDAVARALALRIPGLDAVPPFLSRIVPLGCAMHHCKLVGQECHVYSIESADGPVIFTFSYAIQSTMGKRCCTHDCICDMNWTANLAVLLPGATEAATIFGVSRRTSSGDCLLRQPGLCRLPPPLLARACGIDASMVGTLVAVLAEMSGWGESVYDFCKEICEEYPAPERVEGQRTAGTSRRTPEDCSDGTCECHPSIRHDVEELLLASDRSSLAALAVDLDALAPASRTAPATRRASRAATCATTMRSGEGPRGGGGGAAESPADPADPRRSGPTGRLPNPD